ncbi:hypothetical protein ES692_15865 [Psychroserpens burtonensis]|uniref:Uncharacterized protein n=1 Tax=Psychroserpens burtonensis TaxID=49278 RepID=A0A5C7BAP5_9FLAO|nr:hypothetical protein [Psychroserpens burtonensis]TXE15663.1 hypothetical protein ES692_15865 [Psychroserpens burtonensis]
MRINNSKVKNTIVSVYFILIVLAIVFATIFKAFRDLTSNPSLTFIIITSGFGLLFLLVHFISKYFEYDSDGVKVVVKNSGLLLSDSFNYREKVLEFEKIDLYAYKFNNYLVYRTLTFYIKDSRNKRKGETFNVTLVPGKKRRYIRQSLSKMIKTNKNSQKINE